MHTTFSDQAIVDAIPAVCALIDQFNAGTLDRAEWPMLYDVLKGLHIVD